MKRIALKLDTITGYVLKFLVASKKYFEKAAFDIPDTKHRTCILHPLAQKSKMTYGRIVRSESEFKGGGGIVGFRPKKRGPPPFRLRPFLVKKNQPKIAKNLSFRKK